MAAFSKFLRFLKWKTDLITALGASKRPLSSLQLGTQFNNSPPAYYPARRGTMKIDMEKLDRITIDPAKMNGEPCIRGLRLTVRRVLEALATYPDREELKREYPELQDEDIRQALAFAAGMLDDKVLPTPAHG
jgi:uncharacterized protein (DUF433 family)